MFAYILAFTTLLSLSSTVSIVHGVEAGLKPFTQDVQTSFTAPDGNLVHNGLAKKALELCMVDSFNAPHDTSEIKLYDSKLKKFEKAGSSLGGSLVATSSATGGCRDCAGHLTLSANKMEAWQTTFANCLHASNVPALQDVADVVIEIPGVKAKGQRGIVDVASIETVVKETANKLAEATGKMKRLVVLQKELYLLKKELEKAEPFLKTLTEEDKQDPRTLVKVLKVHATLNTAEQIRAEITVLERDLKDIESVAATLETETTKLAKEVAGIPHQSSDDAQDKDQAQKPEMDDDVSQGVSKITVLNTIVVLVAAGFWILKKLYEQ